ncbi:MAG: threonine/homoserine/homoserine lactone efflux protein [Phenylobacterium sp.]|jgi:threonine/homoserine/homoserine lactone efflux protein
MLSIIFAMCLFALSMSISPGPVNLITLSAGLNHGFKRAMPFVSGATVGFTVLLLLTGLGIGSFATENPQLLTGLGYVGTAFIGYMGIKIATSTPHIDISNDTSNQTSKTSAPTFIHGFMLTWINPKAWIASLAGISAFGLADSGAKLALFVILYFIICYACISCWALLGSKISMAFAKPKNLRIFNRLMGGLLILVALFLGRSVGGSVSGLV